jgi:hypothetical protein
MSFDPFAQSNEIVYTNLSVAPWSPTTLIPNGPEVARAVTGQPGTLTFWLQNASGEMQQITHAQEYAHDLYLHWAFGMQLPDWNSAWMQAQGLGQPFHMTDAELLGAFHTMPVLPSDAAALGSLTDAQVTAYAHWAAPEVMIFGQP